KRPTSRCRGGYKEETSRCAPSRYLWPQPASLMYVFLGVLAGTIIGMLPSLGLISALALPRVETGLQADVFATRIRRSQTGLRARNPGGRRACGGRFRVVEPAAAMDDWSTVHGRGVAYARLRPAI